MIYKGKYLCHRLVKLGRNQSSDLHICIQHSGQRLIFYNFNFIVSGNILDPLCQIVFSFCNHIGSVIFIRIVFDGNRIMGRVGNDHIRFRKLLHRMEASRIRCFCFPFTCGSPS